MPAATLRELLERNARHTDGLPANQFDAVQEGQFPSLVSVCCSDSRVSQEGMFDATEPGWLFTPSTIGNTVWARHDGERVTDGSVLYPTVATDTAVVAVVGHTGCGAVTAALDVVRGDAALAEHPPGIAARLDELVPVVEDGLADDRVDPDAAAGLVDQLVEYNVERQVGFLLESPDVPKGTTLYGFVYDFQGVYGDVRGRTYLVAADGETDPERLRAGVPDAFDAWVRRLL
jgi:carbonic anhydrase